MSFRVLAACPQTAARVGVLTTAHGPLHTPAFMPVGTQATVKGLAPDELRALGAECLLANTYHLALRPGEELVRQLGGLHRFMGWDGPLLTDSGGFQVWSLAPLRELTADGVAFRSHLDGTPQVFTPERVVAIQEALGADIIMPLDVCLEYPAEERAAAAAVETTYQWLHRSLAAHRTMTQQLFGIVQGATYPELRRQAARALAALDLPGYAIGGLSVGEPKAAMAAALAATVAELPADRPRYLMGVGAPDDLLVAIGYGVDLFDCTLPTRMGRAGSLLTRRGRLHLRNARFREEPGPAVPDCGCAVCTRYPAAVLHWLFQEGHALAGRLASYHNLYFLCQLLRDARAAIAAGRFAAFREAFLRAWAPADAAARREQHARWRAARGTVARDA
ncbi:MAG TPA: tRNA guanosine(34) transglycosylase Tgt [Chloroflexota bacterium]|jgi:queuine tRNA-ribosyltransferase|nr:tRNA guanosine(34) transglycosylase Tgt [Chloroflexota bacterium]